ncbi:MAG: galactokinase, partial [Actinomycetota bacterium]|nr:galactokinase [Actinomycetota bacterium]
MARIAAALDDPIAARWFRAPGRVNLMGDHTDYNEGFVLPMAIDLESVVAASALSDRRVRIRSLDQDRAVDVSADGSDEPAAVEPPWGRYVAGVVRALAERGREPVGLDGVLASTVPAGSG